MPTTTVVNTANGKLVVGLMGTTVVFSVIGAELKAFTASPGNTLTGLHNGQPGTPGTGAGSGAVKIIIGGTVATVLLVGLTHAGSAGRQFAVGLALVSMVTATLVYGGPVWLALNRMFNTTPSTATGNTAGTTPTTPGTNTAQSAATVAVNLGGY